MKKNLRKCFVALLLVVVLVSSVMVIKQIYQYKAGQKIYQDAQNLVGLGNMNQAGEDEESRIKKMDLLAEINDENLDNLDIGALREVNKDVIGWITIPGTPVSYPLLDGDDNSYYLNRTWDKKWNTMGSIFLEAECSSKFSEFNTIIYGHNMRNTTMFSSLKKYLKEDFWKEAPYVYIVTQNGVRRYDIFAACEVSVKGHAFWIDIEDDELKEKFISSALDMSVIETGIVPDIEDKIITLSTCTGNGYEKRMVVQAVWTAEGDMADKEYTKRDNEKTNK